jgi:hypothetical protein
MTVDFVDNSYALVAYIGNGLGRFVEGLCAELHPKHAHLRAHVSVLPPRPLHGTEEEAIAELRRLCSQIVPFEIGFGEVETFLPTTPTVFLRTTLRAYRLRELHDLLNTGPLLYTEPLPFMPHVTIAKVDNSSRAAEVRNVSSRHWSEYNGPRTARIEELTFVRGSGHNWQDIEPIRLTGIPW